MFNNRRLFLLCSLLVALAACQKKATAPLATSESNVSNTASFDACQLIKNQEIEAVQGSPIKDTKPSGHTNAGFETAQCFYTAAEFSKSVSFSVTRSDPKAPAKGRLKDFWKNTFAQARIEGSEKAEQGDEEKRKSLQEQKRGKGEEEEGAPLKKIDGIGDDAYWAGNRVGGALYVLKKDVFVRVSVGGADNQETKINKSKILAQKALDRL